MSSLLSTRLQLLANIWLSVMAWSASSERCSAFLSVSLVVKHFTGGEFSFLLSLIIMYVAYRRPHLFPIKPVLLCVFAVPLVTWINPYIRPYYLEICNSCYCIYQGKMLAAGNTNTVKRAILSHFAALPCLMVIRLFFGSLNPVFMPNVFNLMTIVCSAAAFVILSENVEQSFTPRMELEQKSSFQNSAMVGVMFGVIDVMCDLFGTQAGLIPRWAGVDPLQVGFLVICATIVGILLAERVYLFDHKVDAIMIGSMLLSWWICGFAESSLLAFGGGLVLLVLLPWTGSLLFIRASRVNARDVGQVMLAAMATRAVVIFSCICAVAYRNMPIWPLKLPREHTIGIVACAIIALLAVVLTHFRFAFYTRDNLTHGSIRFITVAVPLALLALTANVYSYPNITPAALLPADGVRTPFTAGMWNVQLGFAEDFSDNIMGLSRILAEHQPDIVGLAESDVSKILTGNRDIVQYLASRNGYHTVYGARTGRHSFGSAILSKFPILDSNVHYLPSVVGRKNVLTAAHIAIGTNTVWALTIHLALTEDTEDHALQVEMSSNIVSQYIAKGDPVILLSYINAVKGDPSYNRFIRAGLSDSAPNLPATDRYCEYIFQKSLMVKDYNTVNPSDMNGLSDTELELASYNFMP
eukprot:GILK01003115.1.p1 GENE.GILK01003115.1~~GILK01003115.1.p1  ORF type:complete len:651 (-),score=101.55 GILK01003115.1:127-2046(-)